MGRPLVELVSISSSAIWTRLFVPISNYLQKNLTVDGFSVSSISNVFEVLNLDKFLIIPFELD